MTLMLLLRPPKRWPTVAGRFTATAAKAATITASVKAATITVTASSN